MLLDPGVVVACTAGHAAFEVSEIGHQLHKLQIPNAKLQKGINFGSRRLESGLELEFGVWSLLLAEQLVVLLLLQVIDHRDLLVGDLLHFVEAAPFVVSEMLLSFSSFFSLSFASRRTTRMACVLPRRIVNDLRELFAGSS